MYDSEQLGCSVRGRISLHPVVWNHFALVDDKTGDAALLVSSLPLMKALERCSMVVLRRFTVFFDVATERLIIHALHSSPLCASIIHNEHVFRVLYIDQQQQPATLQCEDLLYKKRHTFRCQTSPVLAVCPTSNIIDSCCLMTKESKL